MTVDPPQPPEEPPAQPPVEPPSGNFPAEQPQGTPANLASWGTRAIGLLIDAAPVLIIEVIVYGVLRSTALNALFSLLTFLYFYLYLGWMDGTTGQTPGKMIMGTRVVDAKGEVIGTAMGIGRKFAHIIDSLVCFIGWFLPLFDAKRQTIADKVVSTYVVEGVGKKDFSVGIYMPPS